MHFCDKCDNMYYINISEESDNIYYYCKKCGNLDNSILTSNNIIYETIASVISKMSSIIHSWRTTKVFVITCFITIIVRIAIIHYIYY